ncbi:lon protease homolog, mitochondrial-like [Octopus sinensis]|uniref:Lon protease homolog, mitochondrial-like n=1 Tax=Octopus sinensis TaxID=2607531 RepID=A0A6P7U3Q9_9MOLL|nr:lon protease homolog, mitochondrial-like [Octopus sinensis]
MLNEQLKAIKRELGILKDDKDSVSEKFRQRLASLTVPVTIMEVIEQELAKLSNLESSSAEFSVTRNYLDWLTSIPWGRYTEDSLDLVKAREILDHDHYGMTEAKDRILVVQPSSNCLGVYSLISENTGLVLDQLTIEKSVLQTLIRFYTRESGVRNLNHLIERIYRKAALNSILNPVNEKNLTPERLADLIGPVKYPENTFYGKKTPVGVTTGLAWTAVGGAVLYVECRPRPEGGSGQLLLTGNLGDVMKESSEIALTVSQSFLKRKYPDNDFLVLNKGRIHLHVPEVI